MFLPSLRVEKQHERKIHGEGSQDHDAQIQSFHLDCPLSLGLECSGTKAGFPSRKP